MKVDIAKMAGTKQGLLLILQSFGYEKAHIKPYGTIDPLRWAEFIVELGAGNGQAVRNLAIIYQGILQIKQASSKPAYLLFTDNEPMENNLMLETDITSYSKLTLNDADSIVLIRDREFKIPLNIAVQLSSYSETVLNSADSILFAPNRNFDMPLQFSVVATSYKEKFIQ